jgi:CRP-like cAMP-binding protein
MPHPNRILSRAGPVDFEDVRRQLRAVELKYGTVIAESRSRVNEVYFPHSGILSCVVELEDGSAIESGMIGKDGVFGAGQAIDNKLSLHKVVVQVPGTASVISADHLKAVAQSSSDFLTLLIKYEQFFLGQVQQNTACNALHSVEQRMCKWLLRMYDLVGTHLPLTQEFMAQMMGVQRTSVNGVARQLQSEGLISYRRGHVTILDIDLVERRACECHRTIRELDEAEFGIEGAPLPFNDTSRPI